MHNMKNILPEFPHIQGTTSKLLSIVTRIDNRISMKIIAVDFVRNICTAKSLGAKYKRLPTILIVIYHDITLPLSYTEYLME